MDAELQRNVLMHLFSQQYTKKAGVGTLLVPTPAFFRFYF